MQSVQHKPMDLQQQQLAFAAYIRDPQKHHAIEGLEEERMAVYRDLFFNNIQETLASAFPVLHKVLDAELWQILCEQFFADFQCHTPYLSRLPYEFVTYLKQSQVNDPPWLIELAQWEWTELELFLAPDADVVSDITDDVMHGVPMLSSLARVQNFRYPVQNISVDYVPTAPAEQTVHLLAWRKPDDDIGFMQLNALSAHLLELIRDNRTNTVHELLTMIAAEHMEFSSDVIMQGGLDALQSFINNTVVYISPQKKKDEEIK